MSDMLVKKNKMSANFLLVLSVSCDSPIICKWKTHHVDKCTVCWSRLHFVLLLQFSWIELSLLRDRAALRLIYWIIMSTNSIMCELHTQTVSRLLQLQRQLSNNCIEASMCMQIFWKRTLSTRSREIYYGIHITWIWLFLVQKAPSALAAWWGHRLVFNLLLVAIKAIDVTRSVSGLFGVRWGQVSAPSKSPRRGLKDIIAGGAWVAL